MTPVSVFASAESYGTFVTKLTACMQTMLQTIPPTGAGAPLSIPKQNVSLLMNGSEAETDPACDDQSGKKPSLRMAAAEMLYRKLDCAQTAIRARNLYSMREYCFQEIDHPQEKQLGLESVKAPISKYRSDSFGGFGRRPPGSAEKTEVGANLENLSVGDVIFFKSDKEGKAFRGHVMTVSKIDGDQIEVMEGHMSAYPTVRTLYRDAIKDTTMSDMAFSKFHSVSGWRAADGLGQQNKCAPKGKSKNKPAGKPAEGERGDPADATS